MALYKRKGSPYWYLKLSVRGLRFQGTTSTTDEGAAELFAERKRRELWDEVQLGKKPDRSWQDAKRRYLEEKGHIASHKTDAVHLGYLEAFIGEKRLSEIDRALLDRIVSAGRREGVKNATINRRLELVRRVLRRARDEWEWEVRVPKIPTLDEPRGRERYLTADEAERLLRELPEHLSAAAAFSLETGLRRANVVGLRWPQVDLGRPCCWVQAHESKSRRAIFVPLSARALAVVEAQRGKHPEFVFTYAGRQMRQVNGKAWKKALARAGIVGFCWHGLRHTWSTWNRMRGMPLQDLQALGGWRSAEMVQRYAHYSDDHLSEVVKRFSDSGPVGFAGDEKVTARGAV